MRELYMAAHDELIERYFEDHPEASEAEAIEATADRAYNRMAGKLADQSDHLRKARQEDIANGHMQARRAQHEREETGDTCGACGVGAGEHADDCPRLMREIDDRIRAKTWP